MVIFPTSAFPNNFQDFPKPGKKETSRFLAVFCSSSGLILKAELQRYNQICKYVGLHLSRSRQHHNTQSRERSAGSVLSRWKNGSRYMVVGREKEVS